MRHPAHATRERFESIVPLGAERFQRPSAEAASSASSRELWRLQIQTMPKLWPILPCPPKHRLTGENS